MRNLLILLICVFINADTLLFSQGTKIMDESVYAEWNVIQDTKITSSGDWLMYSLKPDNGNTTAVVYNTRTKQSIKFDRAEKATFDHSGKYLYFIQKPSVELEREQKRNKIDKEDMATDTLIIYDLIKHSELTFPSVSSFTIPEKAGPIIAAQIKDDKKSKKKNSKSQSTDDIIFINPASGQIDTIKNVIEYVFAEESTKLLFAVKSDSIHSGGIFMHSGTSIDTTFTISGKIYSLVINKDASQAAFVVDTDTTDVIYRPYQLFYWNSENTQVTQVLHENSTFLPDNWSISNQKKAAFSDDGSRLFFGIHPQRLVQDTLKLEEEIVNVEVWHYKQPKLYTQQELDAKDDEVKSYDVVYLTETEQLVQLQTEEFPDLRMDKKRQSKYALLYTDLPYKTHETWQGYAERDIYKVDVQTGQRSSVAKGIHGRAQLSPNGKYIFWYSSIDSTWVAHNTMSSQTATIGNSKHTSFANELHDAPSYPRSYGIAGWSTEDESLFVYDRYDIWKLDPNNKNRPEKMTNGRSEKIKYRYVNVDEEDEHIDMNSNMLVHIFDEKDKSSGYGYLDLTSGDISSELKGAYHFTTQVIKAKDSDDIIYTKQSFKTFPNLIHDNINFSNATQVSDANPQQSDYAWGDNKIFEWTAFDGQELEGILALPPGFDPKQKYPLLVNFYERSSDRLHRHRAPSAGRSTINYSFYTNRGYVIFNPDVPYKIGDPGESCYNAVISGIAALIAEGFIDKEKIGVQGHSWGGYQVAHLVTKTNVFACAESGAPLVNMTSAYGGIRWGTGRSRQFQYEKTQSRLGVTLWESPETYIRNSPLFAADKIETPVLIMHNDADGHVPWHLGIEFFMALRRLQKPAWFLNYNGEPHWPLKWQNRLDFNIRMQQYFDHYLKDAPMPVWMKNGIPAIEKGIRSGYETADKK